MRIRYIGYEIRAGSMDASIYFHRFFFSNIIARRLNAIFILSRSAHQPKYNPKITRFNFDHCCEIWQMKINGKTRHGLIERPGRWKIPRNYSISISLGRILLISIVYGHGIYPDGTRARTHAESVGKRLNWSDYPLVHKEIATSISWCTYVTIKSTCTYVCNECMYIYVCVHLRHIDGTNAGRRLGPAVDTTCPHHV